MLRNSCKGCEYSQKCELGELPTTYASLRSGGFLVNIANATSLPKL